jgi:DNA modification methylase
MNKLYRGDCLKILRRLPDASVQCCVTSPPYWGLRDYGVAGQLGLEPTPEAYVARMVEVFREVRQVLRDDGTLWLNIGDSYAASGPPGGQGKQRSNVGSKGVTLRLAPPGFKSKDLVGIPWRLAFALQADGWYLRSDIIWHKPNPMPESVRDRPTKAHEYIFLLSKSARYFWDAEAVREEQTGDICGRVPCIASKMIGTGRESGYSSHEQRMNGHRSHIEIPGGRNVRSVWTITPKPFKGAHFATFPPALVERCVKAGTSERGCCPHCGKPWKRVVEPTAEYKKMIVAQRGAGDWFPRSGGYRDSTEGNKSNTRRNGSTSTCAAYQTLGFRQSCSCPAAEPVPCVVLDPFIGSGTTAAVAKSLGRDCIGIDLQPKYLTMARARIKAAVHVG